MQEEIIDTPVLEETDPIAQKEILKKIQDLSKAFNIPEPDAVAVYGYLLQIYRRPIELKDAIAHIQLVAKKPIPEMQQIEKLMLIKAGILRVKAQPFLAPKMPGRNDECPCGSGKKFKKCCIELAEAHLLERLKNGQ